MAVIAEIFKHILFPKKIRVRKQEANIFEMYIRKPYSVELCFSSVTHSLTEKSCHSVTAAYDRQ